MTIEYHKGKFLIDSLEMRTKKNRIVIKYKKYIYYKLNTSVFEEILVWIYQFGKDDIDQMFETLYSGLKRMEKVNMNRAFQD